MKRPALPMISAALLSLALVLSACGPGLEGPGLTPVPVTGGGSDACLEGAWEMSNDDLNVLMSALTVMPGMSIPLGTLSMLFQDGEWSYVSNDLLVRIDVPGGYMEADAVFLYYGDYSTSGGMVTFSNVIYDVEAYSWRASINGGMEEIAGPHAIAFPVPGNGYYYCSGDSLSFSVTGANGDTGLFFSRVR